MKISIITVVYNCEKTIADTILSVALQSYANKEHIIIDGASTDGTMKVVRKYARYLSHIVSEPDNGMYDAMNKGIRLASGDIIGILNADDVYYDHNCVQMVSNTFEDQKVQAVCGDIVFVSVENPYKVMRYYTAASFKPHMFAFGMMPPHPGFFVQKKCYEKFGTYKIDYLIASDFDLLARFLFINKISYACLPKILVKMRIGGVSTKGFKSNWILNKEILRACKENNIETNMGKILLKYLIKMFQLIDKPDLRSRS